MNKAKKSIISRIRITRRGKIVRRPMAVDHFRTSKSKKSIRRKRKSRGLNHPLKGLR